MLVVVFVAIGISFIIYKSISINHYTKTKLDECGLIGKRYYFNIEILELPIRIKIRFFRTSIPMRE